MPDGEQRLPESTIRCQSNDIRQTSFNGRWALPGQSILTRKQQRRFAEGTAHHCYEQALVDGASQIERPPRSNAKAAAGLPRADKGVSNLHPRGETNWIFRVIFVALRRRATTFGMLPRGRGRMAECRRYAAESNATSVAGLLRDGGECPGFSLALRRMAGAASAGSAAGRHGLAFC